MTTPYGSDPYAAPGESSGGNYGQQPQYGQPQYGQPQYGQPQYGQPQYGQPQYGQPYGGYPQPQSSRLSEPLVGWVLLAIAVLGCIGSTGTWANVDFIDFHQSINGTGSGKDGTITIVLMALAGVGGLLIGIKLGKLWVSIVALVVTALTALTAFIDIADISNGVSGAPDSAISVGWGLWLTLAAGILGAAAAVVALARRQ